MANNIVAVTEGATGSIKSVATETINSVDFGVVKLVDPTIGATIGIGVSANPMKVSLATTSITQPVNGTVSVGNFPATTTVLGTVSLGSNPTVGGTVSVGNTPSVNLALSGTAIKDDTQFGYGVTTGVASVHSRVYNGTSYDPWTGAVALRTDALSNSTSSLTPKFAALTATASGNTLLIASVSSKKIRVLSYGVVTNATTSVKFGHGSTDVTGPMAFVPNSGITEAYTEVGLFETAVGAGLNINLSAAATVGGRITYVEV